MMIMTTIVCGNCGKFVDKPKKEIDRQVRKGRSVFYCSISCHAYRSNSAIENIESNRRTAFNNFQHLIHDPEHASKAKFGLEGWKYSDLIIYFRITDRQFMFEYPLVTDYGHVRLYDLCLPELGLLIEFDGEYHTKKRSIYFHRDEEKNLLAKKCGWNLIRVFVEKNSIIPVEVLRDIL